MSLNKQFVATKNGSHEINLSELTIRPPKPKSFNSNHHFLFYADDYLTYQYGGDPAKKLKQNKKNGTKVDENNDWL